MSTPLTDEERQDYRQAISDTRYPDWPNSPDWPITIMASVLVRLLDEVEELKRELEPFKEQLQQLEGEVALLEEQRRVYEAGVSDE